MTFSFIFPPRSSIALFKALDEAKKIKDKLKIEINLLVICQIWLRLVDSSERNGQIKNAEELS